MCALSGTIDIERHRFGCIGRLVISGVQRAVFQSVCESNSHIPGDWPKK